MEDFTGKIEYKYEFGEAIKNEFICDYDIFVPDITVKNIIDDVYEYLEIDETNKMDLDTKAHFLLRCMEENGHSKCIAYLSDVSEASKFIKSLNRIKDYYGIELYLDLIVSGTSQKQRKKVLKEFADTIQKAIICSVRILDECIDIPACDSVFMASKQTNKIRMIQRVCRANRKDKNNPNKKSGVYLWTDEYDELTELVASLKEFDNSFTKEKLKMINVKDGDRCIVKRDDRGKEYMQLDNIVIGIRITSTWLEKLNWLKKYFDDNKCVPSITSNDIIVRQMVRWMYMQNECAKNRTRLMKNDTIYAKWLEFTENYEQYFKDYYIKIWFEKIELLETYLDDNKYVPTVRSDDIIVRKMASWMHTQKTTAKKRTDAMKNDDIYNKWLSFVEKYKDYIINRNYDWHGQLKQAEQCILKYKSRPSEVSKDPEIRKHGVWIQTQINRAKTRDRLMKSDEIYYAWVDFVTKYKEYFKTNIEIWMDTKQLVETFIIKNNIKPLITSKDQHEKSLGNWLSDQFKKAKKRTHIMKNDNIYEQWCNFCEKYENYLRSSEEKWKFNLREIETHILKNESTPCSQSKLGGWLHTQKKRIQIMKNDDIYLLFCDFLTTYKQYFNQEIIAPLIKNTTNDDIIIKPVKNTITTNDEIIVVKSKKKTKAKLIFRDEYLD